MIQRPIGHRIRLRRLSHYQDEEEPMSELEVRFEAAAIDAKNLSYRPDNKTMLQLYSLYKHAVVGDVSGRRPVFTDFTGRAKYDAWTKLKGTSSDNAKQAYIDKVDQLSGSSAAGGSAGFGD
jgi:acyl-CoA-binding protein